MVVYGYFSVLKYYTLHIYTHKYRYHGFSTLCKFNIIMQGYISGLSIIWTALQYINMHVCRSVHRQESFNIDPCVKADAEADQLIIKIINKKFMSQTPPPSNCRYYPLSLFSYFTSFAFAILFYVMGCLFYLLYIITLDVMAPFFLIILSPPS